VLKPGTSSVGSLPALSPDGSKLAFASEPAQAAGCLPSSPNLTPHYKLVVRTLGTGAETTYPMVPPGQDASLPAPISHLSWSPDGQHLAVSISTIQDNEGWNLALVDTATAKYYLTGAGVSFVPVTGQPSRQRSYLREGVYLPDGELFVSRACCAGVPVRNTSRLMWEVTTAGTLVHQVAVGYANLEHTSLDSTANGAWLLYLAGHGLQVSQGGATPRQVATGLIAAAWQ
jgi:WD40-like Beta Propeller Repeat